MKRVFVDMDGVIVDFDAYMIANNLTANQVKKKPGAYFEMSAIPGAIPAVRRLIEMGFEVWIATKPPTGVPLAYADKVAWVMKHLPELERRIVITHDKGLLGDVGDYLCDDRPNKANCEQFAGTLLRFVNGYHWPQALDYLGNKAKTVEQTLDDTESWILETVQSAERLLLGTTEISYWVKFSLADKVNSKLTREKEVLIYVSGNTKTKYYCATENVAILAQSLIVLLDDDNSSNPVSKALFPCSSVVVDASDVERGKGGDKVEDFSNTLKRRFYELTPFRREILANNYTKVEHYRDNEWRTKKGAYFHKDGIYRVGKKHEGH